MVRIGAGIRLLDSQRDVAQELLEKVGKRYKNRWMVMRQHLESVAHKADTENPEECVSWRPVKAWVNFKHWSKEVGPERLRQREAFFVDFCKSGILSNPAHAELLWSAFCKHVLHTLVNRQEPVDMLFIELNPLPYRPNWKALVTMTEWEKLGQEMYDRVTLEEMVKRGTADHLLHQRLTFYNRHAETIHWTVEIRHMEMWYRMVAAAEKARKKGKTTFAYLRHIEDAMKRSLPTALKCYASYLAEIFRPSLFTKIHTGAAGSPGTRTASMDKRMRAADKPRITPSALDPASKARCTRKRGHKKPSLANVPGVSNLQPTLEDMRDFREEMGQPSDGE